MSDGYRILKYALPISNEVIMMMPNGGVKPLHVGEQDEVLTVWVQVPEGGWALAPHRFRIYGTGSSIPSYPPAEYVGTAQMSDGLVWHVYYEGRVHG